MERAAADARYARLHEDKPWHNGSFSGWSEKPSMATPYKFDMGVTIGVSDTDLRPDDEFLTVQSARLHAQPDDEGVPNGHTP